jgi:hypothetical protein
VAETSLTHSEFSLEAGVDWLTCTARHPARVAALLAFGHDMVRQEEGGGGVRKTFRWQGFSGWTAGGAGVGFNGYSSLVRLSGPTARESATDAIGYADNISRLDVQTTVRVNGVSADLARNLYACVLGGRGGRGRPITRSLIQTSDGGDSLYLGRRISDSYGRIYNKSAEDKEVAEYPRWRYEIEFKRKMALAQAKAYAQAPEKEAWCVARVYHWFKDRGCPPSHSPVERVNNSGASRGDSAQARRIEWLKVGVRPVVKELALEYGWPDVLSLLGVPMSYSESYINETLCQEE